jgi:hypothetical protein
MKKPTTMPAMPMKGGKGYPMKPKGKGGKKAC